jgi:hypothetical protein
MLTTLWNPSISGSLFLSPSRTNRDPALLLW